MRPLRTCAQGERIPPGSGGSATPAPAGRDRSGAGPRAAAPRAARRWMAAALLAPARTAAWCLRRTLPRWRERPSASSFTARLAFTVTAFRSTAPPRRLGAQPQRDPEPRYRVRFGKRRDDPVRVPAAAAHERRERAQRRFRRTLPRKWVRGSSEEDVSGSTIPWTHRTRWTPQGSPGIPRAGRCSQTEATPPASFGRALCLQPVGPPPTLVIHSSY